MEFTYKIIKIMESIRYVKFFFIFKNSFLTAHAPNLVLSKSQNRKCMTEKAGTGADQSQLFRDISVSVLTPLYVTWSIFSGSDRHPKLTLYHEYRKICCNRRKLSLPLYENIDVTNVLIIEKKRFHMQNFVKNIVLPWLLAVSHWKFPVIMLYVT